MVERTLWGRTLRMQGGPLSLVAYSGAFGSDMLSDISSEFRKDSLGVEALLRFIWAMCRTHDPETEDFESWLDASKWPDFSLADGRAGEVASVMLDAASAELFRRREALPRRFARALREGPLGRAARRAVAVAARILRG